MNDDDEYHVLLYNIMYFVYVRCSLLDKSEPLFFNYASRYQESRRISPSKH